VSENPVVRVDCCETCHGYVKTFDLRQAAARDVVPIVDDVATLSLDLWVQARGFQRASFSFAGA
jgi:FdhE protein